MEKDRAVSSKGADDSLSAEFMLAQHTETELVTHVNNGHKINWLIN